MSENYAKAKAGFIFSLLILLEVTTFNFSSPNKIMSSFLTMF